MHAIHILWFLWQDKGLIVLLISTSDSDEEGMSALQGEDDARGSERIAVRTPISRLFVTAGDVLVAEKLELWNHLFEY